MKSSLCHYRLAMLALIVATASSVAAPKADYGKIELLRDTWGIPHVFSDSDAGAMYGLGYATAQERGFQMTYSLQIIQGRLAEVVGDRPKPGGKETALEHDRKMRTFGWTRAAVRTAAHLDPGTRQLLEAYCEGVNDSFAAQQKAGTLHPMFKRLDVTPEPWTPADCLLSWWHLAQFFAGDGTRDLLVWRNRIHPPPGQPQPPKPNNRWMDDSTAVVQREDVSEDWLRSVTDFCAAHGLGESGTANDTPKFSHAWVVVFLPQVLDPKAGFLLSANHRAIGSYYRIPLGTSTGSMGDTIRSWRLRERMTGKDRFSPAEVLDIHYDTVDPAHDLAPAAITCLDGQTIHCQAAQSYTQWVPLHDVDTAQTICPIGHSDRPESRYRTSTMALWGQAKLHPAPLSREAVEKIAAERMQLAP